MEDWFIGVNSTGQRRAFNLMPNSITFNRATYDEMLKSSKPLTLEAWYTPEEIKKINE